MSPSPDAVVTLAGALSMKLRVIKPSGARIVDAQVEVEWEEIQNPYETPVLQRFVTAASDLEIPVLDPKEWWIAPDAGTLCTIRVNKPLHGPIVPYGQAFAYGALIVRFRVLPGAQVQLTLVDVPQDTQVLWGYPRIVGAKGDILEVTLMEGGELGAEHPGIPTRRLSAVHRPTEPPTTLSQIDQELLFHIAHGGLALTPETDYQFETVTDAAGERPELRVKLRPTVTGAIPVVPRGTARNSIAGGLRFMHLLQFQGKSGLRISGPAGMTNLNPRLMVGVIRFARTMLELNPNLKVALTSGFGRAADDSHGQGRAIDFAGFMLDVPPGLTDPANPRIADGLDPNCTKKTEPAWKGVSINGRTVTVFEKECVAERDFIVLYHWGLVQLVVETATGPVRRKEDRGQYRNDFDPLTANRERLLYRLSVRPTAAERGGSHVLTDLHYDLARDLFAGAYVFFVQEFSHRDTFLGPVNTHPNLTEGSDSSGAPRNLTPLGRLAAADDAGGIPLEPGRTQGGILHPDYPAPDGSGPRRQAHANHIHANLGAVKPHSKDFER